MGAGINPDDGRPFGTFPSDVLEVYFTNVLQRHHPNLSSIESQEYPLHPQHLLPVQKAWQALQSKDPKSQKAGEDGTDLNVFLRHALPDVATDLSHQQSSPCTVLKGSPAVLIVTSDSGRAANLCTEVSNFLSSLHRSDELAHPSKRQKTDLLTTSPAKNQSAKLKPAKLFGRHFKLEEQQSYLFANAAPIAVGTPARLRALINEPVSPSSLASVSTGQNKKNKKAKGPGNTSEPSKPGESDAENQDEARPALNLEHLQYLVIDTTFRDKKNRNIFESDDARPETLRLLLDIHQQRKQRAEKLGQDGKGLSITSSSENLENQGGDTDKEKKKKKRKKGEEDEKAGDAQSQDDGTITKRRAEKAAALTKWVVLY